MTKLTDLILTQDAYIYDEETYIAHATHKETKEEYEITWEITCPGCEDESDACDWDNPIFITKL